MELLPCHPDGTTRVASPFQSSAPYYFAFSPHPTDFSFRSYVVRCRSAPDPKRTIFFPSSAFSLLAGPPFCWPLSVLLFPPRLEPEIESGTARVSVAFRSFSGLLCTPAPIALFHIPSSASVRPSCSSQSSSNSLVYRLGPESPSPRAEHCSCCRCLICLLSTCGPPRAQLASTLSLVQRLFSCSRALFSPALVPHGDLFLGTWRFCE